MAVPPQDPPPGRYGRYRGYWGTINRPYMGCGCLYPIAVFFVILLLVSAGVAVCGRASVLLSRTCSRSSGSCISAPRFLGVGG